MKPLHQSYSNIGNWKFIANSKNGNLEVAYNTKSAVIGGIIVIILCCIFGIVGHNLSESKGGILFLAIGFGTAFLTGSLILGTALGEKIKGPILVYSPLSDTLRIRDLNKTISEARKSVEFSSEKYRRNKNDNEDRYRSEFNIIIHGERKKFLSHISSESFSPLISFAIKARIRVTHHIDKNKT